MNILKYEIYKILNKILFVLLLLLFLMINASGLNYVQSCDLETSVIHNNINEYESIISEISNLSNEEKQIVIQSKLKINEIALLIDEQSEKEDSDVESILYKYKTENPQEYIKSQSLNLTREKLLDRQTLLENLINQVKYISDYGVFIGDMDQRAEQQLKFSIFGQKNSFSYNNILKTSNDFENLKEIKLEIGNNLFVENATTFILTDLLVFALLFLMCIYIFSFERDRDLYRLIRTTQKGYLQLIASKMIVVVLLAVVISAVYYASNIIVSGLYSGFGDMSGNIQSVKAFMNCNLNLHIWQYLIMWVCSKAVTMCVISAILSLIFVFVKNTSMTFVFTASFVISEWLLYAVLGQNSSYNQLKYINVFYFLIGNNILGKYLNIDIFSQPINLTGIYLVLMPAIFIGLIFVICFVFIKQTQNSSKSLIDVLFEKLKMRFGRSTCSTSLLSGECFKHYKGSMAILALVLLAFVAYSNLNADISVIYSSAQESAYSSYLTVLEGPVTPQKEKYLKEQQNYFDNLNENLVEISNDSTLTSEEKEMKSAAIQSIIETKGAAFSEVLQQADYIKEKGAEFNLTPQFINKIVYKRLLENPEREWYLFSLLMVIIIFVSSNVFAYEHKKQMTNLIRYNRNGKFRLVITKTMVALFTTIISFSLVYLPYYINFIKTFGTVSFNSPIIFIQDFSGVNSAISINEMICTISIVHFVFALMAAMLVIMFSQIFKNNIISMIVSSALILFPCILCMNLSEFRLYTVFQNGIWLILVLGLVIVSIIVFALCFLITYVSFSKINIERFGRTKNAYT